MHELSIALSIVDIAETEARKVGSTVIERIDLDIGTLSGVEIPALEFAWNEAVKNTVLEKAERKINVIQAKAKCLECSHEFEADQLFAKCPNCGEIFTEIVQGQELKVKSLTLMNNEQ